MKLRQIAHSRTGDKGNTSNISVIAFDSQNYEFLRHHVTAERVRAHFTEIVRGEVTRHEMPSIGALNFVLSSALLDLDLPDIVALEISASRRFRSEAG